MVSRRRNGQRLRSSLVCPIRRLRRLRIAQEGQLYSLVQRVCDNVWRVVSIMYSGALLTTLQAK